jgi:hypothetical protein
MSPRRARRVLPRPGHPWFLAGIAIVAAGLVSCRGRPATASDCGEIVDRIVQLELEEKGYRDPVLSDRKRREIRNLLGSELKECQGKRLRPDALSCVRLARNAEKISHDCLR